MAILRASPPLARVTVCDFLKAGLIVFLPSPPLPSPLFYLTLPTPRPAGRKISYDTLTCIANPLLYFLFPEG